MANRVKKKAYPSGPPQGTSESKRGYPKENFGTARYPKGAFPGNADHAGKAPGAAGKGYSEQVLERNKLPAYEEYRAFPKNPGQFD